jgi:hypothetical protein
MTSYWQTNAGSRALPSTEVSTNQTGLEVSTNQTGLENLSTPYLVIATATAPDPSQHNAPWTFSLSRWKLEVPPKQPLVNIFGVLRPEYAAHEASRAKSARDQALLTIGNRNTTPELSNQGEDLIADVVSEIERNSSSISAWAKHLQSMGNMNMDGTRMLSEEYIHSLTLDSITNTANEVRNGDAKGVKLHSLTQAELRALTDRLTPRWYLCTEQNLHSDDSATSSLRDFECTALQDSAGRQHVLEDFAVQSGARPRNTWEDERV